MKDLPKINSDDGYIWVKNNPIAIRTKPTSHKQTCRYCRETFKKHNIQVRLLAHSRKMYYYHEHCFMCLIERLERFMHTNLNCESCEHRFMCFTGD